MSFRKNRDRTEGDDDVKVSVAKDSKKDAPVEQSQTDQSQSQQDQGQGQPQQQQEGQSTDQQAAEEESADEEDSSSPSIEVPSGTTAEILKWVGEDKQRAQAALDKEKQADRPRSGLTGELEEILQG